jgi:hypothetical protein
MRVWGPPERNPHILGGDVEYAPEGFFGS